MIQDLTYQFLYDTKTLELELTFQYLVKHVCTRMSGNSLSNTYCHCIVGLG